MVLRFVLPLLLVAAALGISAPGVWGADTPREPLPGQGNTSPEAEDASANLDAGTKARLLKPRPPAYPPEARSSGQEGWVILSYTVGTDGSVIDPIVEDSSGVASFEKAALQSARRYRYTPATWNGKPVEQCAAKIKFSFHLDHRNPRVARSSFKKSYLAAVALIEEKRVAEAEIAVDEMMAKGAWTNYESSKLWLLRAVIQSSKDDQVGQLRSLRRAAFSHGKYIEPENYPLVLRSIFGLEVGQRQYLAALGTYAMLKNIKPEVVDPALEKVVLQIRGAINWQHELLRRKFAFNDIKGDVGRFELRCDWKRVVDDVSTEKTWEVPMDWGWCQMFVFGEVGAKVTLVEYPLAETQKGIEFHPDLDY
jgi:TonB family protein